MEVQELRIGNYVKVTCPKAFHPHLKIGTFEKINYHHLKDICTNNKDWIYEPIELTEDILLKCPQFKKIEHDNGNYFEYGLFLIKKISDDFTLVFGKQIITNELKYLHDFQNKIFALTNQELTINL